MSPTPTKVTFLQMSFKVSPLSLYLSLLFCSPFFLPIPSSFSDFSLLPLLLHSGSWSELKITNVQVEKSSYLKQANKQTTPGLFRGCSLNVYRQGPTWHRQPVPISPSPPCLTAQGSSRADFSQSGLVTLRCPQPDAESSCAGSGQGPANVPWSPGLTTASNPLANQVEELFCLGNSASKLGRIYSLEFVPEPNSSLSTD